MWFAWWAMMAAQADTQDWEAHVWARDVQRLSLEHVQGELSVERSRERIEIRLPRRRPGCTVSFGDQPDEAIIRIEPRSGRRCRMNLLVRLPPQAHASLVVGRGDIHVRGVDAAITARIGKGTVRLVGAQSWTY